MSVPLVGYLSGTPIVTVLGSPRLDHVIVQSEVETVALDPAGEVRWRVAHSDVIAGAELTGGMLTLQTYAGRGGRRLGQRPPAAVTATAATIALERDVDERWTGRCVQTPHKPSVPLTTARVAAYRRPRPEGALEPTNGQDDITAHVAWQVPSGRCLRAARTAA